VLTNIWGMGDTWKSDRSDELDNSPVHLWIVPARVEGYWTWDLPVNGVKHSYAAVMEQQFQKAEGVVRVGNRRGVFDKMILRGKDIEFSLAMTVGDAGLVTHSYSGKVQGNEIVGTVRLQRIVNEESIVVDVPWRATRSGSSAYFAPTGLQPAQALEPAKAVSKKPSAASVQP
jgi:hypothetical protein